MDASDQQPSAAHRASANHEARAVIGLLLATVMWGCGFTWAKAAADAVHRESGLQTGSALGPIFVLAWRFVLGGVALFVLIPAARRGWTFRSAWRITGVGLLLSVSIVIQHLGLDRTSEAVSAFLTNLTVVCVPLIVLLTTRRAPSVIVWGGVGLAVVGIWLMTGAQPEGFGWGEVLGIGCAIGFSVYIVVVNNVSRTEDPWRMTAGQFIVTGLTCTIATLLVPGGAALASPHRLATIIAVHDVWRNVLLLTAFTTIGAFTLLNFFQPRLDPTRAALIYLIEPICAAAYAFVAIGRRMTPRALVGGALILLANLFVEVLANRSRRRSVDGESAEDSPAPATIS